MLKHKDDISVDYLHYLRVCYRNKNRKRKRLEKELDTVLREIKEIEEGIEMIEKYGDIEEERKKWVK